MSFSPKHQSRVLNPGPMQRGAPSLTRRRPPPKQQRGAGLVEVLIASVIFLFSFAGLSRLAITTIQTNALAKHFTTATSLAERQLETMRGQDFLTPASGEHPL